jgi:hypothetical protein
VDKFRYFYKYIIYQMGRQEPYPPTYLIIYVLLNRLGEIAVDHFNQLYRVTAGVRVLVFQSEYLNMVRGAMWKS